MNGVPARMTKRRLEFLKRVGRCEPIPLNEISRYWRNVTGLVETYYLSPELALATGAIDELTCARMTKNNEVIVPLQDAGFHRLQLTAEGLATLCAHDSEWAQIFGSGPH